MRAYYELPYNNTEIISVQVLDYPKHQTSLLVDKPKIPWNFLDRNTVLDACPELLAFFKLHKLVPRDISVTICYEDLELHYDAPPVVAKINFPVLNTANSVNRWYTISDADYASLPWVSDGQGSLHEDIKSLSKEKLIIFDEYSGMTSPIVFHSRIPHEVILLENATTPRIVLSCTFHNEPIHYLQ